MTGSWKVNFEDPRIKIVRTPISDIEIEAGKSERGGFTKKTLAEWGIPWPPLNGWRATIRKHGVPLLPIDTTNKKTLKKSSKRAWDLLAAVETTPLPVAERSAISKAEREAFYASWDWRTLRMMTFQAQGKACRCCGAKPGDITISGKPVRIVVDHIRPIAKFWHLRLDRQNLQVLCDECNQGKGAWDTTDYREF